MTAVLLTSSTRKTYSLHTDCLYVIIRIDLRYQIRLFFPLTLGMGSGEAALIAMGPIMQNFDDLVVITANKLLNKQSNHDLKPHYSSVNRNKAIMKSYSTFKHGSLSRKAEKITTEKNRSGDPKADLLDFWLLSRKYDVIEWNHFPRHWPFVRGSARKASHAEFWCFFDLRPNKRLSKQSRPW